MIRRLRIRHRRLILLVALLTAAALLAAVIGRSAPATQSFPPALGPHADPS